jgi:E3 ubiquitin-protein ligase RNF213
MCIIYLRVQSQVPVIIMGETGCGKTSLIRFFSQNILNDHLEIFNIHAGVTFKNIIDRVRHY